MTLIFDGHLDLAMNALGYERDQRLTVAQLRQREARWSASEPGLCTTSVEQMRRSGVPACLSTVIARARQTSGTQPGSRFNLDMPTQDMAYAVAQGQLAYYRALERQGCVSVITSSPQLQRHWEQWLRPDAEVLPPVGVIVTMEGADPIVEPRELADWWRQGLRTLMLAHIGPAVYAGGTPTKHFPADAPVSALGRELIKEMMSLKMALDLTHLCEQSFFEAIDLFHGPVYASHSNCRSLAPGTRQLSDAQLRRLIERGGVVGVALHIGMLARGPDGAAPRRSEVGLDTVARHIDHVCQLAGDARHAALGTDLDGGFGAALCPHDFDGPADLARVGEALRGKGYTDADVEAVLGGNWLAFFERHLPGG